MKALQDCQCFLEIIQKGYEEHQDENRLSLYEMETLLKQGKGITSCYSHPSMFIFLDFIHDFDTYIE